MVATFAAALCASCGVTGPAKPIGYCAFLPDTVGLYQGNPITQMGYQVGTVIAITPSTTNVRVDFTVDPSRPLPSDVKAVIRSTSLLADRSLELVGNYHSGPRLRAGQCIALTQTSTPKSLSEVIGSATTFLNAVNPSGSTNVGDVVHGLDAAVHANGTGVNRLLTTSSAVLDMPGQAVGDLGSIVANLKELTATLREMTGPMKQILLDADQTTPDAVRALVGGRNVFDNIAPLFTLVADLEVNLGGEFQQTFDVVAVALRKMSAHSRWVADLLNPVPWWINTLANHFNNRQFSISYRPPMYRVRTPDGLAACGIMNASMPGSCADVAGQPYAVDVALLQYVLAQASR